MRVFVKVYGDEGPLELLNQLLRDVRYATRSFRRSPGLAGAVIMTLALAIGANTAIFSLLEAVILDPLPYHQPDRLVVVALYNRSLRHETYLSYPDFLDWRQNMRSFEEIAAIQVTKGFDLTNPGSSQHVDGNEVSSNFFRTLGVNLQLGREMSAEEDQTGGVPAVVISDRLWRNLYAGSPGALGKTVTLDGVDYAIVGVLRPGFRFDKQETDVYTSIARDNSLDRTDRTIHNILCIGRLQSVVSMNQALAELNTVQQHIDDLHPETERGQGVWIQPLKQYIVGDVGGTLWLLSGAVGLLLLIACANITNLLLARSTVRTREFAIRLALGAARAQILRQLIVESVLLSLTGCVMGLAVARWGVRAILVMTAASVPRIDNIGVNGAVLWFAFAVSTAVGIVFGLVPALQSSRTDVQTGLSEGGRNPGTRRRTMQQRVLVILQVALTLVLLTGGSLLFRTIANLWSVHPGFDPQQVITFQVGLSPSVTTTASRVRNTYRQLVDRIQKIPGVEEADITGLTPFSQSSNEGPFWLGSHPPASMAEIPRAIYYPVGPDYFRTMRIPLIGGRIFTEQDTVDSELVVIVDSLMVRTYFSSVDPIGQLITIPHWGAARNVSARIVGVAGHVEHYTLDGALGNKPQIYYSFYQLPEDAVPVFRSVLRLAVRTPLDVAVVMPSIRSAVYASGGDQPVYNVQTMQEFVSASMGRQHFAALVLLTFASLAFVLASVGTYAVISYSTAQRLHEIGIRLALGAKSRDVLRLVVKQGLWLGFLGVAIGTIAVLILAHILPNFSHLLYGVHATDPLTIGGASLVLLIMAAAACFVPALRAARSDLLTSLRSE